MSNKYKAIEWQSQVKLFLIKIYLNNQHIEEIEFKH